MYMCRHLKPGGYLDLHEYDLGFFSDDGTYSDKSSLCEYYALVNKAASKSGDYNSPPSRTDVRFVTTDP